MERSQLFLIYGDRPPRGELIHLPAKHHANATAAFLLYVSRETRRPGAFLMLESFTAVVNHSLRSGRSTLSHCRPDVLILNIMARPTRAATHADFFTPRCHQSQPRRPRGNERIRESAAKHSCATQCSDWLCILNESFWLSSALIDLFSLDSCADIWARA